MVSATCDWFCTDGSQMTSVSVPWIKTFVEMQKSTKFISIVKQQYNLVCFLRICFVVYWKSKVDFVCYHRCGEVCAGRATWHREQCSSQPRPTSRSGREYPTRDQGARVQRGEQQRTARVTHGRGRWVKVNVCQGHGQSAMLLVTTITVFFITNDTSFLLFPSFFAQP